MNKNLYRITAKPGSVHTIIGSTKLQGHTDCLNQFYSNKNLTKIFNSMACKYFTVFLDSSPKNSKLKFFIGLEYLNDGNA